MEYTVFAPLGDRPGKGTYDTFWDNKYKDLAEGLAANDVVVIDFVKDVKGVIYFRFYNTRRSDEKEYYRLGWQNFIPALGVDTRDDWKAIEIGCKMF